MPPLSPSGTSDARAGATDAEKKANEAINDITAKRMPAIPFARSAVAFLWASPSKKPEGWRVNDRERRRFVALLPHRTRADNGAQRAMLVSGAGGCGRDGHRLVSAPSSDRSGGVPAPYARARRGAGAVERGGLENRCPPCGGPRVRIPPSPPAGRKPLSFQQELGM